MSSGKHIHQPWKQCPRVRCTLLLLGCLLVLANRVNVPIHLLAEPHYGHGASLPAAPTSPPLRLALHLPKQQQGSGKDTQARALAAAFQRFTLSKALAAVEEQVHQELHRTAGPDDPAASHDLHTHRSPARSHEHPVYDHEIGMASGAVTVEPVQLYLPPAVRPLLALSLPPLSAPAAFRKNPRGPPAL